MKTLFIFTSDGGDGSYYPRFTLNKKLVAELQKAYDDGLADCENCIGIDGDGFHYAEINVPDESTYESLGINYALPDDYANRFKFGE